MILETSLYRTFVYKKQVNSLNNQNNLKQIFYYFVMWSNVDFSPSFYFSWKSRDRATILSRPRETEIFKTGYGIV